MINIINEKRKKKALYLREYRLKNKDMLKEKQAAIYIKNKEKILVDVKKWAKKNKDKTRLSSSKWCKGNREKRNIAAALNTRNNPQRNTAKSAKNRAVKLQATPGWGNDFFIKEIYHLAALRTKMFGFKWHVDHIVPLKSKRVCGLHCEANMQVISQKENISKSNRHWPNM